MEIRGYGPVKEIAVEKVRADVDAMVAKLGSSIIARRLDSFLRVVHVMF